MSKLAELPLLTNTAYFEPTAFAHCVSNSMVFSPLVRRGCIFNHSINRSKSFLSMVSWASKIFFIKYVLFLLLKLFFCFSFVSKYQLLQLLILILIFEVF